MNPIRVLISISLAILVMTSPGCLKKSITNEQIEIGFQNWMDTPYQAPSNERQAVEVRVVEGVPRNLKYENFLLPEERITIESFKTYRNILKVQLVKDTPHDLWKPVGSKCARAFGMACRDASFLESTYYCELRILAVVEGEEDNFLVGNLAFSNLTERITPDVFMPSRSRK